MQSIDFEYEVTKQNLLEQRAKIDNQLDAIELVKALKTALSEEAMSRSFEIYVDIKNRNIFDYINNAISQNSKIISADTIDDTIYSNIYFLINSYQMVRICLEKRYVSGFINDESSYSYQIKLEVNTSRSFLHLDYKENIDKNGYNVKVTNLDGREYHDIVTHQDFSRFTCMSFSHTIDEVNIYTLIDQLLKDYEITKGQSRL